MQSMSRINQDNLEDSNETYLHVHALHIEHKVPVVANNNHKQHHNHHHMPKRIEEQNMTASFISNVF